MKSNSLFQPRNAGLALSGIGLALGLFASQARADQWDKKTILTVNETIQVKDKVLPPGKYTLRLLNSQSDRHIVQIYNGDQTKYIGTVLAVPAYRMEPAGDTKFTFWETPAGTAKALRDWYYPGDNFGEEFSYPKQLASLDKPPAGPTASENTPTAPDATPTPATSDNTPLATPPPTTSADNDNMPARQSDEQQAAVTKDDDQDQPPQQPMTTPTPTPTTTQDQTSSADRSAELPKTASPYPAIGALGLLSLALFGGFRLKRFVKQ